MSNLIDGTNYDDVIYSELYQNIDRFLSYKHRFNWNLQDIPFLLLDLKTVNLLQSGIASILVQYLSCYYPVFLFRC